MNNNIVNGMNNQENEHSEDMVSIPVVELFDEYGEKMMFELLEKVEFDGDKYVLITPYFEDEDEYDLEEPAEVYIMKEVVDEESGEPALETVEDEDLLQSIYAVFKDKHAEEFEFKGE